VEIPATEIPTSKCVKINVILLTSLRPLGMITKLITVLKQTQAEEKEKKRKETKATKTWRKYLY